MQAHSPFYISLSQSCRLVVFFSINHSLREKQEWREGARWYLAQRNGPEVGLVKLGRCAWLVGLRGEDEMERKPNGHEPMNVLAQGAKRKLPEGFKRKQKKHIAGDRIWRLAVGGFDKRLIFNTLRNRQTANRQIHIYEAYTFAICHGKWQKAFVHQGICHLPWQIVAKKKRG